MPWPQGYIFFSWSTQLTMTFILLVNIKMPTILGILTFISRINTPSECIKQGETFIFQHFLKFLWAVEISCSAELNEKSFRI